MNDDLIKKLKDKNDVIVKVNKKKDFFEILTYVLSGIAIVELFIIILTNLK